MKKLLIITILLSTISMFGCRDYLDINRDPNFPNQVDIDLLVPTGLGFTTAYVGYEMSLFGNIWGQYATQATSSNQYNSILRVNLTYADLYFVRVWSRIYANAMPSFLEINEKAVERGDPYIYYRVLANTMIAFNLHMATSVFDVIYWEGAFQGNENPYPEYHTGVEGYRIILGMLEDILALDLDLIEHSYHAGANDYIFKGDGLSWMKFANSLYLKMLLRDFEANRGKITSVLADAKGIGFLDGVSGDASMDIFSDEAGQRNPLYASDRVGLNTRTNLLSTDVVTDYMTAAGDPRLPDYSQGSLPYRPAPYGSDNALATNHDVIRLGPVDAVQFMSVAETYLLLAEAYARLGQSADAKANYDLGVTAALARWGYGSEAPALLSGEYQYNTSASVEDQLEQIITQKWLAAFRAQTWDAWFDINRTGYPERGTVLSTYTGQLSEGNYPRRFLYPQNSKDFNPNAPQVEPIYEKMWWHR